MRKTRTEDRQIWISKEVWEQIKALAEQDHRTIRATCEMYLGYGMRKQ